LESRPRSFLAFFLDTSTAREAETSTRRVGREPDTWLFHRRDSSLFAVLEVVLEKLLQSLRAEFLREVVEIRLADFPTLSEVGYNELAADCLPGAFKPVSSV